MATIKLKEIATHTIKSCGVTEHNSVLVTKRGLLNDRIFMVVDPTGLGMTQREYPRMALINVGTVGTFTGILGFAGGSVGPTFSLQEAHGLVERQVKVFKDHDPVSAFDQGDEVAAWLTDHLETPCRLVRMAEKEVRQTKRGEGEVALPDAYPILGVSTESQDDLNGRMDAPVSIKRLRANLIFKGGGPFSEDRWRRIRIDRRIDLIGETLCARCSMPLVDQETGEVGKEPIKTMNTYRHAEHLAGVHAAWKLPYPSKVYFGRNFNVVGTGIIAVGMEVEVLEMD